MDWTAIWAPPPIGTPPTTICRLVIGRSCTAASVIPLPRSRPPLGDKRLSAKEFIKVRVRGEHENHQYEREAEGGDLGERLRADWPPQNLLRRDEEQVPPVERQQGEQVDEGEMSADKSPKRREDLSSLRRRIA